MKYLEGYAPLRYCSQSLDVSEIIEANKKKRVCVLFSDS